VPELLPPQHEPSHVQIAEQRTDRRPLWSTSTLVPIAPAPMLVPTLDGLNAPIRRRPTRRSPPLEPTPNRNRPSGYDERSPHIKHPRPRFRVNPSEGSVCEHSQILAHHAKSQGIRCAPPHGWRKIPITLVDPETGRPILNEPNPLISSTIAALIGCELPPVLSLRSKRTAGTGILKTRNVARNSNARSGPTTKVQTLQLIVSV